MSPCIIASSNTALCQADDLRAGFRALGHHPIIDYTDPATSFVFVGNGPYSSYADLASARKVIFNVLDCPHWLPSWPAIKAQWEQELPRAAALTCISKTVQRDIEEFFGLRAEVIYYPMKDVRHTGEKKYPFRVAMAGRLRDPGKRVDVAIKALIAAGFDESEVAMIGPEYPGWGTDFGTVNLTQLNDLFNSVDYVLMTSEYEGIGLPAVEGGCCGAVPIVMPDLTTFGEFWADSPLGLVYRTFAGPSDIASILRHLNDNPTERNGLKEAFRQYGERVFRPKFDRVEVARRIVNIYNNL